MGPYKEMSPRFLNVYAELSQIIITAFTNFRQEVESGAFPTVQHNFTIEDNELARLLAQLRA